MDYKSFMELGVKRNSLEYHKIFCWILVPPNTISPSSVEFRRTLEIHHFHWHQVPLNFHGIFHEIPWNFVAKSDVIKIHGLSWNLVIADLNDILFPRTSMEFSIEVHGTSRVAIPNITRVPGNSIELGWCHFKWNRVPWNSMEFHRTLPSPNQMSPSFMEYHGTSTAPFQMTPGFHGIPWNSMESHWKSMRLPEISRVTWKVCYMYPRVKQAPGHRQPPCWLDYDVSSIYGPYYKMYFVSTKFQMEMGSVTRRFLCYWRVRLRTVITLYDR